jgi:cation:H+ antiporter
LQTPNRSLKGSVFLAYYADYKAYLILIAQAHHALPQFSAMMSEFVLPITVMTLAITLTRYAAKSCAVHGAGERITS